MKKLIIALVVVVLLGAGLFVYRYYNSTDTIYPEPLVSIPAQTFTEQSISKNNLPEEIIPFLPLNSASLNAVTLTYPDESVRYKVTFSHEGSLQETYLYFKTLNSSSYEIVSEILSDTDGGTLILKKDNNFYKMEMRPTSNATTTDVTIFVSSVVQSA